MRQVAAAVIVENGRLLLARRPAGDLLAGMWELPGGKVEPGETLPQCLERELREELDMTSRVSGEIARTVYEYAHGSFELIALETTRLSGFETKIHDCICWARPEEILDICLAPADVELVSKILQSGVL